VSDATAKGAAIGATAGTFIPIPGLSTALGAGIGALVGGIIDVAGDISDALSDVADFLGLGQGAGENRTKLRATLGPTLANILRAAPARYYWFSYTQIASWIQQSFTTNNAMQPVFKFDDDPSFVQDVMNDVAAAAPPPPGTSLPGFLAALAMPFSRNAALYGLPTDAPPAPPPPKPQTTPKVVRAAPLPIPLHEIRVQAPPAPPVGLHPQLAPPPATEYTAPPHEEGGGGLAIAAVALLGLLALSKS
jgi:hypothetical protein